MLLISASACGQNLAKTTIPPSGQQTPSASPQVPSAGQETPSAGPQVPSAGPQVPSASPQVPSASPQVPSATQETPSADPQVPPASQEVASAGQEAPPAGPDILKELSDATARTVSEVSPAVVGLWVDIKPNIQETALEQPGGEPSADGKQPSSPDLPQEQFPHLTPHEEALGSGFIVSSDGDILTNNHVVGNADRIQVALGDHRRVPAKVVGTDPATDLAVIKISDVNDLPYLELGNSDDLKVGDWVLAIGQPFGLSHTVTAGIVSGLGRNNMDATTYEDFIQTDAAINPGNSGGPLVTQDGKVVGINTMIIGSQGNIGIGFAIPANIAKNVYQQIKARGKVIRGHIGVDIQDLTPDLAAAFGLPSDTAGVMIAHVADDSPAAAAGLKQGDVIVKYDGKPIENAGMLQMQISMLQPGTSLSLTVLGADHTPRDYHVILGNQTATPLGREGEKEPTVEALGMIIQDPSQEVRQKLHYQNAAGVFVLAVANDSIAEASGIVPGMLIEEVDRQPVKDLAEFEQALKKAANSSRILLLVNVEGAHHYVVLVAPGQ